MAITLFCPACKTRLTVGDDRAGTTFACPKCSTAISVSVVEPASPAPPSPLPPPVEIDYKPVPEPDDEPERDDEPDPDYRPPRRRRKKPPVSLWIGLGLAFLVTVCVVGWLIASWARNRTTPVVVTTSPDGAPSVTVDLSGDGPDWTYLELLNYLRSKGLKVSMESCSGGQMYVLGDQETAKGVAQMYDFGRGLCVFSSGALCRKMTTAKAAKEEAERTESGTFYWGRFYFRAPPVPLGGGNSSFDDYDAVRKVLLGR